MEWALKQSDPFVKNISHMTLHYRKEGLEVVLEVSLCNPDMTFREAASIARRLEEQLLKHPKISKADVHLETKDHC
jgi:divalent metal cation (Fe/Co/Zn/Cd) transporter